MKATNCKRIRLSVSDKNKASKEGISSAVAKHAMGVLRLYECSRIRKRHWVRQSKHQKPRGGSRGAVTRIFPAVSPGRGGVVRGNLLVRPTACQLRSAPGSARSADSIQSKGVDAHEIQFVPPKFDPAGGNPPGRARICQAGQSDHQHHARRKNRQTG